MGKGRPRAVEKGVLGQSSSVSSSGSSSIPPGPVYYPSEDDFKDPLEYIYRIRPEAEPYGICRIVPPESWKPPFGLDLNSFTFPTKTQAIHQLQARPAACDSKTFDLEYTRFLENHCGKKVKKRVVFEGGELDFCKLFNAVKRFGGYDKVVKEKKWGEVVRFVRSERNTRECAKHVLCQLYREHLYDYEEYYNRLNHDIVRGCKRGMHGEKKGEHGVAFLSSKRRRRNSDGEKVKICKVEKEEEEFDQICEQCGSGLHGELMLLCDRCNKGWHIYCLSPPLKGIPPGNWYCLECLNSDKDSFGFVPGKHFSLEAFRRVADRAKKKRFGPVPPSRMQLEKTFWEIVEGLVGEVEVMYGSDLDTSVYGSGFPRVNDKKPESIEAEIWDKYCASPWNLNNLPKLQGSMLRAVHHNIAGVMVPWLYVGMLFSSFCWHFEDHCFYSMNYLHWGEPKCWYSVPGSEASAFEKVMRNCLPDLFDAQPDLLFQLVTMLNPSVLQENGVPVYSVLQEPGNFVITFPRSYHGGFNFGLNCAEAVNFAPADWLPHGGFGAELYQLYRKASVLSHEELICAVAKAKDCDSKALPYLSKELNRIYAKEKKCREGLWRNGIIKSSPMSPKKSPEFVGTEEDPTCIICQQYLFLSAVVCCCRPSAFVCLEHWKHLCECKHSKHRLLYRYTLAELKQLVLLTDKYNSDETPQCSDLQRQLSCSDDLSALTKKVRGGHVSLAKLAEGWLFRSSKIFQIPYSGEAYSNALKETEQFLWAGSEMDAVRAMAKNLIAAQNWAEGIKDCLCKIESWSCNQSHDLEKVDVERVNNLLNLNPPPCIEPGHLKLKGYAEHAMILVQEIDSALSASSKSSIRELEQLYSRACEVPIHVKEVEKLQARISALKVWVDNVRKCIHEKCPAAIEVDVLYKLKSEMLELQVQLPEAEMLLDLLQQVETCQARCSEILNSPINLKNVELLLQELDSITVNIPKLKLLRQYHGAAVSWISHFNDVCVNIHEREDQENVVDELKCILKQGLSMRIQVDELPLVEVELKKAYCRKEALQVRRTKMTLFSIQQLMEEAAVLQIEGEQLFIDISGVLAAAMHWEERAVHIFASKAQMSDFEDAIRTSEDIHVILPSLEDVKDAISMAKSWLKNSKPFLGSSFPATEGFRPMLKIEALKELVSQSNLLKISMAEQPMIHSVLKNCLEWEHDACSLLEDVDCLFNMNNTGNALINSLIPKIECVVSMIESVLETGLSLGFDFDEIPKLQNACSALQWCNKALSFCTVVTALPGVESLMENVGHLPFSCASSALCSSLIDGVKWLKRASEVIPVSCNHKRCKLSDAVEVLSEVQRLKVSFPLMVDQLLKAFEKHKLWKEKTHIFFGLKTEERTWSKLLKLKELGKNDAFSCCELDMILSESEKVEKWKQHCLDILGYPVGDVNSLLGALLKIKHTLDRSLYIYNKSRGCNPRDLCSRCFCDIKDHELLSCSICKDWYHLQCLGAILGHQSDAKAHVCSYCQFIESGSISRSGGALRFGRKCPELGMLNEILSDSEGLCRGIEERDLVQQLVGLAITCKDHLVELTDFALAYLDRDLSITSEKLTTALKAVEIAGVYDNHGNNRLDLALARNSWRVRVNKLLENSRKPLIQHIQKFLKEGLAIRIPPKDYFWQKLTELKGIGLQWAENAKKVSMDSGALGLDKVCELITQGENLPVHFEKELKLLRARSLLYCICRKPYDHRAMIACDQCDEWYHFDCINLSSAPKIYICPACKPQTGELTVLSMNKERSSEGKYGEPQTPSPPHTESRRKTREAKPKPKPKPSLKQMMPETMDGSNNTLRYSGGMDFLLWRNRKPFRRAAKRRAEVESLSRFFHIEQQ